MKGKQFTIISITIAMLFIAVGGYFLTGRSLSREPVSSSSSEMSNNVVQNFFTRKSHNVTTSEVQPTEWAPLAALFHKAQAVHPPRALPESLKLLDKQDTPVPFDFFKGKITVLNMWALWCAPCLRELPLLKQVQDELSSPNLQFAYISMDYPENASKLYDVMKLKNVDMVDSFYINDLKAWQDMTLRALPTTYILNEQGQIIYELFGDIDWINPEAKAFLTSF
jgi:thiol-disulfide isomerase/thioredoxin